MVKENNNTFMLIVGLVLALFLLVGQSYILSDSGSVDESISVGGLSEISVAPDMAYVYVSINTKNVDAKIAQSENSDLSSKVVDALKNLGISEDNIETISFRLDENYDYSIPYGEVKDEVPRVITYEAVHSLKVKTTDLKAIGTLVDVVISAGANGVNYIEYTLSDELELVVRADALEKSIISGQGKAESMTKTLGVELGDVIKVNENNYYSSSYNFAANVKAENFDSGAGSSLNSFSPQNVKVTSSVSLEYKIQ
jgi:uncharacterized protein YggE